MKQDELTYKDVDIMSGIEFLQAVQSGSITDYDGFIAHVFVDGYNSNLGLVHNHLMDGEFLVDEKAWLNICKEHKVEIDWANK